MLSIRFNRRTLAVLAFAALAAPGSLSAQTPDHPAGTSAQFPTKNDLKSLTTAGSYLAARHASVERDASSAAAFYRSALRTDPKNNELLDRAFISSLADGDIDEAVKLADRILMIDKSNRVARLVVGVRDLKQKKYAAAQLNINQSIRGPITDLVATLLSGWASYGAGDSKSAVANIDKLTGPEWYPIFKDLHSGMILELAGKEKDAGMRLERAYKLDDSMLRVADAYARWLSRGKDPAAATAVYAAFDKKLARHPLVQEGLRDTKAGKKLTPLVDSPQSGAAEALYGIGATLTRRGGEDLALVYLQLSLYLAPNHPLALLSLADLYESVKKPKMAIKVYERMPASSPLKRNAQIQLATNLDTADRSEEAIKILKGVTAEDPKDIEAIMALGNIERGRKRFADCAQTYTQAIDVMPPGNEKGAWVTYYYRGICHERCRHAQGAGAAAGAAPRAELSRLLVDRSGHQSRRGHEDDQARRRTAPRRRLHRGLARLGLLPHRQFRGRGEASRARDRPQAGRSDHQRPSGRRLLARRPHTGSQIPVGPRPRPEA